MVSEPVSKVAVATDAVAAGSTEDEPTSGAGPVAELTDPRPNPTGRWRVLRDTGVDLVSSAGEWVGLIGPTSNWMSRLTCAAVALVLVSGLSLLMATSEPSPKVDDVAIEAFKATEPGEGSTSPIRENPVQQTGAQEPPAGEANARDRNGPIESAVYQTTTAPRNRGAWLEGRIELE